MTAGPKVFEGNLDATGNRFIIIVSRFNSLITEPLLNGALDTLRRHGADMDNVRIVRVPGAWELPLACKRMARSLDTDAVICLGAIIRGATPHFEYVSSEASKGIGSVSLETGIPIAFGLLTTDTIEQAIERAGSKAGNKGAEAATAAIEMANLFQTIGKEGL